MKFLLKCIVDFNELYPQIEKEINECDFCSFDTELSGITPFREINSFDTLKTRYDKIRKVRVEFC